MLIGTIPFGRISNPTIKGPGEGVGCVVIIGVVVIDIVSLVDKASSSKRTNGIGLGLGLGR